MKTNFKTRLLLTLLVSLSLSVQAQDDLSQISNTSKPRIMIIPFRKEGEDIRKIYEDDANRRVAIDKIREGFGARDFETVDFVEALEKALTEEAAFGSINQNDLLTKIVSLSGADIFVEVEVLQMMATPTGNAARIRLNAKDASTFNTYSTKVCESPKLNTTDSTKLIIRAISKSIEDTSVSPCLEDFLNRLQSRFVNIKTNGRPVRIIFSLSQNSDFDFSKEMQPENQPLAVVLNDWMKKNAYKNFSHLQGYTQLKVTFDEVRIPYNADDGQRFEPSEFAEKIRAYLSSRKFKVGLPTVSNGTIYFTFN